MISLKPFEYRDDYRRKILDFEHPNKDYQEKRAQIFREFF